MKIVDAHFIEDNHILVTTVCEKHGIPLEHRDMFDAQIPPGTKERWYRCDICHELKLQSHTLRAPIDVIKAMCVRNARIALEEAIHD